MNETDFIFLISNFFVITNFFIKNSPLRARKNES